MKALLGNQKIVLVGGLGLILLMIVACWFFLPGFKSGLTTTFGGIFGNTSNAVASLGGNNNPTAPADGSNLQPVVNQQGDIDFLEGKPKPEPTPVKDPYEKYPILGQVNLLPTTGSAVLLQDGIHSVLMDTSSKEDGDLLIQQLNKHGVKSLRYLILTNYHPEALGGATTVLENFKVDYIILSENVTKEPSGQALISYLNSKHLLYTVVTGQGRYPLDKGVLEMYQTHESGSLIGVFYLNSTKLVFTNDITVIDKERYKLLPKRIDALFLSHRKDSYTVPEGLVEYLEPKNVVSVGNSESSLSLLKSSLPTAEYNNKFLSASDAFTFLLNGFTVKLDGEEKAR